MRRKLRLTGSALGFLLPGLFLARWLAASAGAEGLAPTVTLPDRLDGWHVGLETRLDENALSILQPDSYSYRRYEAQGRAPVWVYVGVYGGRAAYGRGAHDPEVCFPAHGFEVVGSTSTQLTLPSEESLRVDLLEAQSGHSKQSVLYWFQPAGRWPESPAVEQLMRLGDALAARPQYAFVRLSSAGAAGPSATGDLSGLARAIAPHIRAGLESDPKERSSEVKAALDR